MDAWQFDKGTTSGWIECCLVVTVGQSSTSTCVFFVLVTSITVPEFVGYGDGDCVVAFRSEGKGR